MYRIRAVDGQDEDVADTLADIHRSTFLDTAAVPNFDHGHWWLAFADRTPVAFAGLIASTDAENVGYFCRVGVLHDHVGNSLQNRLMRAMELKAKRNGWSAVMSDTTDNIVSANNFIRSGYRLFRPKQPWAWPHTLYWYKSMQ